MDAELIEGPNFYDYNFADNDTPSFNMKSCTDFYNNFHTTCTCNKTGTNKTTGITTRCATAESATICSSDNGNGSIYNEVSECDDARQCLQDSSPTFKDAAESCRGNGEIVLAAVEQDGSAVEWASDELLEDSSFALEAKH
eukprot:4880611-Amphidinium_carterae.1